MQIATRKAKRKRKFQMTSSDFVTSEKSSKKQELNLSNILGTPLTCSLNKEIDQDVFEKKGGFPSEWIERNKLEGYLCVICMDLVHFPAAVECGHFFCKQCLAKHISISGTVCPMKCKTPLASSVVESKQITNFLSFQSVTCLYESRGCVMKPALGVDAKLLLEHASSCQYRVQLCDYCGIAVFQRDKVNHQEKHCPKRPVKCLMCKESIYYVNREQHVLELPIPDDFLCVNVKKCPLDCDVDFLITDGKESVILKGILLAHDYEIHNTKDCGKKKVKCLYCDEIVAKENLQAHLESSTEAVKEHLKGLYNHNLSQSTELIELRRKVATIDYERKKRLDFDSPVDEKLEAKYTKLMEERTIIYAQDCNGEWAKAQIIEILPAQNVKVRFVSYSSDWDIVINTILEDYKIIINVDDLPPFLEDRKTLCPFQKGEKVWAARRYNWASGTELIRGTVDSMKGGQVRIIPDHQWSMLRKPEGERYFHLMEVQPISSWKSHSACPSFQTSQSSSPPRRVARRVVLSSNNDLPTEFTEPTGPTGLTRRSGATGATGPILGNIGPIGPIGSGGSGIIEPTGPTGPIAPIMMGSTGSTQILPDAPTESGTQVTELVTMRTLLPRLISQETEPHSFFVPLDLSSRYSTPPPTPTLASSPAPTGPLLSQPPPPLTPASPQSPTTPMLEGGGERYNSDLQFALSRSLVDH